MKLQDELREEVRSHAQFSSAIFDTREDARWKAAAQLGLYEAALREAEAAMTCRRDDFAHYCPNCDNSLDEARGRIRAILNSTDTGA